MSKRRKTRFVRYRDPIRRFNKRILNPIILTVAGRRGPYAALHHAGRKTGHQYTTPVLPTRVGDHFIIPLPYGEQVDWCRNVRAAGGCRIQWKGKSFKLDNPEMINAEQAMQHFPPFFQRSFRRYGVERFLRLRRHSQVG